MAVDQLGLFITLEGIEGVGKSTSIACMTEYLTSQNIAHRLTREPGGTPISEAIRQLLLSQNEEPMAVDTELLLVFAARAEHLDAVINPTLAAGKWLICDRFTDASFAYQGGGRGIAAQRIAQLATWVQGTLKPDVTFLLDAPVDIAMKRAQKRSAPDRIESEQAQFFERVRMTYLERAAAEPERFVVIDATQKPAQVRAKLLSKLQQLQQEMTGA